MLACQALAEQHPQSERDIGIAGGIARGAIDRNPIEAERRLARACDLLIGNDPVAEMLFR